MCIAGRSPTVQSPTARICPRRRPRKFWRRDVRGLSGESRAGEASGRAEAEASAAAYRQRSYLAGSGLSDGCAYALRSTGVIGVLKLSPLGGTGDSNHFL